MNNKIIQFYKLWIEPLKYLFMFPFKVLKFWFKKSNDKHFWDNKYDAKWDDV